MDQRADSTRRLIPGSRRSTYIHRELYADLLQALKCDLLTALPTAENHTLSIRGPLKGLSLIHI